MPRYINMKLILLVTYWSKESFLLQKFFWKNEVERHSKYEITNNGHFRISLTLRCASRHGVKLRSVHPTTESSSAVCFPPWSQGHQVSQKTLSVQPTPESDSAECFPPRSQALRCASHRRVKLRGVLHTAESSSAVCITPRSQNQNFWESLVAFKRGGKMVNFFWVFLLPKRLSRFSSHL